MITTEEIIEKELKDGRDYMYIGGLRYRSGDCLLYNGQEMIIKTIIDQTHFFDQRNFCMHSNMFYDQKWEHCPERNADKKTKDRSRAAIVADRVIIERENFKISMVKNQAYQVYDEYGRIYFYEKVGWNLINRGCEPDTTESEALLKQSDKLTAQNKGLLANMYWNSLDKKPNIGSKFDIDRFITAYVQGLKNQQQAD